VLTTALAFVRRDGALAARVARVARVDIVLAVLTGLTRDLDRIDEAFVTGGVAEGGAGSFRAMEVSERAAAFFRGFFDGFIEGRLGSVAVLKCFRASPTLVRI
jgi:hypothetical protein